MHLIITSIDGTTHTHSNVSRDRARRIADAATRHPRTLQVLVFSYAPAWGLIPLAESDALVAAWKRADGWITPDAGDTQQEQDTMNDTALEALDDAVDAIMIAEPEQVTAQLIEEFNEALVDAAQHADSLDALAMLIKYAAAALDMAERKACVPFAVGAVRSAQFGQGLDELPTFGGAEVCGDGVWSWDDTRLLVGHGGLSDWHIISRSEWRGH